MTECQIIVAKGINYHVQMVPIMTLRYASSISLKKMLSSTNYPRVHEHFLHDEFLFI